MRKLLICGASVAALTMPATALAGDDYNPNGNASACGQYHGAFGAFGKDNNYAGGANGQETGAANSAKGCQDNL
jgi:hypothetical protein